MLYEIYLMLYNFSVIDVIGALINSKITRNYGSDLKRKLVNEGSELYEKIVQLKIKLNKEGKMKTGDKEKVKGYYIMNDKFFNEFVLQIIIDKKYLSQKQLKMLQQEPIEFDVEAPF